MTVSDRSFYTEKRKLKAVHFRSSTSDRFDRWYKTKGRSFQTGPLTAVHLSPFISDRSFSTEDIKLKAVHFGPVHLSPSTLAYVLQTVHFRTIRFYRKYQTLGRQFFRSSASTTVHFETIHFWDRSLLKSSTFGIVHIWDHPFSRWSSSIFLLERLSFRPKESSLWWLKNEP